MYPPELSKLSPGVTVIEAKITFAFLFPELIRTSISKNLPFKHTEDGGEQSYAAPMETSSSNKQDRGDKTLTNTPEKTLMGKITRGTSDDT